MKNALLRDATSDDSDTLLGLVRELAQYEKLENQVIADAATLAESLFGRQPKAFAILAEVEGVAVGFCVYFYNFSTFVGRPGIYIEDIFVRESHRGLGIGKRFFARIAEIARTNNCGRIEWWVLNWNKPALDFYERMDATPMSEWTVYRLTEDKFDNLREKENA